MAATPLPEACANLSFPTSIQTMTRTSSRRPRPVGQKRATAPTADAAPEAEGPWVPPTLAGYRWALEFGTGMAAWTLELLRAQRAALVGTLGAPARPMAPAGARLTIRDVYDCVEAAGYHEISEIEWEDGRYEVEARDADGHAVELRVDGESGAIERTPAGD